MNCDLVILYLNARSLKNKFMSALRKAQDQLNSKTSRLDPSPTWLLKQHWNEFEPFLVST